MNKEEHSIVKKIHVELLNFPFSAAAQIVNKDLDDVTLKDILGSVRKLKGLVEGHIILCNKRDAEYLQLSRDVDATRRLLSFNYDKAEAEKN